jgi:hypothetical protein
MTNIITEIMVEMLRIFGIAMKELRWSSASEFWIGYLRMFSTKERVERFLRKLARMADLEGALKKLDRLTQEARMALADAMKISHCVRDEVKVEDIGDKVEDVIDKVQCVDERVQVVITGAQGVSILLPIRSNVYTLRWQGSKIDYSTDREPRGNVRTYIEGDQ